MNQTTHTVRHMVILGLVFVTLILIIFLGDVPISLIAALTIPCSLLFAFSVMVLTGPARQPDFDWGDRFRYSGRRRGNRA